MNKLKALGRISQFDSCGWPQPLADDYKYQDFIYPSVANRRIVRLFKVLQTNYCEKNCFYCANRRDRGCSRYKFSPYELACVFMNYYRKRIVEGFFLSSSIYKNPDFSQEEMLSTIKILRQRFRYSGYIHFVILPGASFELIREAKRYSDRLSINLEVPNEKYLAEISPEKNFKSILNTLRFISDLDRERPLKAGISTQFVIGAGKEKDREILERVYKLYKDFRLTRVFYSGFSPILNTPLETSLLCPSLREFRLYQADMLLRKYDFSLEDLSFDENGNLFLEIDPKLSWAKRNQKFFPVEVNKADYRILLRVPGIGKISTERIIKKRKDRKIKDLKELKRLGVIIKRAKDFITLDGKSFSKERILAKAENIKSEQEEQLFIFDEL